jgi:alpha-D-glucose phosphate-specific phosphoglucomutase
MIRFTASGWRALIAEEITMANVRRVAGAVARVLGERGTARRGVFIGYDTRFLSERFAREAAAVLAAQGVPVTLASAPAPTPAIALAVVSGRKACGLNITAGHDPPEYSGMKFTIAGGAPAPPDMIQAIERLANEIPPAGASSSPGAAERPKAGTRSRRRGAGAVRLTDIRSSYLRRLGGQVRSAAIRKARLKIACDPRHGASIGYLDGALAKVALTLETIHVDAHPEFRGEGAGCEEPDLKPLARLVRRGRLHLGLATDGDGDRFGIVDAGGAFIQPNHFHAILADYLLETRRPPGGVARSVATTHLIDAVCALHGRTVYETAVGFAHLSRHLRSRRAFLACEENAGLGLRGHVPERDGILAGLLAAEMVAVRRKSLRDQISDLLRKVGPLHSRRIDYHTDAATRDRLMRRLEDIPSVFAGKRIARCDTTDGRKLAFTDGSWILFRPAGGLSIVRCYGEARSTRDLEALMLSARDLIARP